MHAVTPRAPLESGHLPAAAAAKMALPAEKRDGSPAVRSECTEPESRRAPGPVRRWPVRSAEPIRAI